jgi:hypothetical protein
LEGGANLASVEEARPKTVKPFLTPPWAVVTLGVVFFGSMILAAAFFPHGYEWYRTVISSLDSPRDNPRAYGIACGGLALTGLILIPCGGFLQRRLAFASSRSTGWAGRLFLAGSIFLTLSALLVPGSYHVLGMGRVHERLAQVSGAAFCFSLLLYLDAVLHLPKSFSYLRFGLPVCVVLPILGFAGNRALLIFAYEFLPSANYQAIRSEPWSRLALWEWSAATVIYGFLALVALVLPEPPGTEITQTKER